jgi:transcriptional regulator with XRE-family HTH domain
MLRAFTLCVKTLRARRGIAQEALAYEAGIDRAYMGGLERGEHMPSLEMIHRICGAFEITFVSFAIEYERCVRIARRRRPEEG